MCILCQKTCLTIHTDAMIFGVFIEEATTTIYQPLYLKELRKNSYIQHNFPLPACIVEAISIQKMKRNLTVVN